MWECGIRRLSLFLGAIHFDEVVILTDFERVLGKRKALELQERQQQQQQQQQQQSKRRVDSEEMLPGLPHPSLRYYCGLAGHKVTGK